MSKSLPLTKLEMMRGGASDCMQIKKANVLEFCMAANTELEQLTSQMKALKIEDYAMKSSVDDDYKSKWELQKELNKLMCRHSLVSRHLAESRRFGSMFYQRASKVLNADDFALIKNMALQDSKAVEEGLTVPHEEPT